MRRLLAILAAALLPLLAFAQSPPAGSQVYTTDNNVSGTLGSLNAVVGPLQMSGEVGAALLVPSTSTLVGVLTPYCSADNTTWSTTAFYPDATGSTVATLTTVSGTAYQYGIALISACKYVRVMATSYTSGTVSATLTANQVGVVGSSVMPGISRSAVSAVAAGSASALSTDSTNGSLNVRITDSATYLSPQVVATNGAATGSALATMPAVGRSAVSAVSNGNSGKLAVDATTGFQLVSLSDGASYLKGSVVAVNSTNTTNALGVEAARALTAPTAVATGNGAQLQTDASNGALYAELIPTVAAVGLTTTGSATVTTSVNFKASAGNLYGFGVVSGATAGCWLQCVNSAAAGTLGTAVIFQAPLPNAGTVYQQPTTIPIGSFSSGIACGVATAVNGATACGTSSAIALYYK